MGTVPTTPHLGLALPPSGESGWTTQMNGNLTAIDAAIYALQQGGTTGPAGAQGPAGAVGLIWAGPWSSSVNYVATDAVSYNGSSYIARSSNSNTPPDLNPNTWNPISLVGAQGPAGPTGPQGQTGPASSGAAVSFPISIPQGGTGAGTAPGALAALGAAAAGANHDITQLTALVTGATQAVYPAIAVSSPGGSGNALSVTNGVGGLQITTDGYITGSGDFKTTGRVAGDTGHFPSGVGTNQIANDLGLPVTFNSVLETALGMVIQGSVPAAAAGQIGIGAQIAATASPGGGQATPATVAGYLVINNQGTAMKIALYAV